MNWWRLTGSLKHCWPVVVREMRAESRRPVNFWLRVLTAALAVGVFVGFMAGTNLPQRWIGPVLYRVLNRAMLLTIWVVVPLMTADCISREKREGTLGLLFLTPMTVADVMLGKATIHILRAVTFLLAALPVLILPFIIGGVPWQMTLLTIASFANAMTLAICAGIFASARGGTSTQVMVMAALHTGWIASASAGICFYAQRLLMPLRPGLFPYLLVEIIPALILAPVLIRNSARVLRETWDKDPEAHEKPEWVAAFSSSDSWQELFHWEKSRTLDRNPMAWLQEYSWTARLTKWGWFVGLLFGELFLISGFPGWQPFVTLALSLGVAFSAAGSFRRERQSGLLEVLLVTPLSVRQLLGGRLWGIFCHFFPAILILMIFWEAERNLAEKAFAGNRLFMIVPNPVSFLALMVAGLYLSLWRANFFVVWLLAWAAAFFLPAMVAVLLQSRFGVNPVPAIEITSVFQLALAVVTWVLLYRDVKNRRFLEATTA